MNTKFAVIAICILAIGFIGGHLIFPRYAPSNLNGIESLLQSKNKLYESAVNQCFQLAKNIYVRDFINLCKKDQPSSSCDTTDFNSALGYGVVQLGTDPSGDFAKLHKTYEADMNLCIGSSVQN